MEIPLANPSLDEEMLSEAHRVLEEEFFVGGETVSRFESELETYFEVNHAIAVDSGTKALQLALEGKGIGEGDTVLTTPATFIATANAIVQTGATPRFVDIDLDTYGPDLSEVKRIVEMEEIDAILPIHLYGYPMDIERLRDIAGDIPIISDACQAHGAMRNGRKIGSIADAAALSFYPSKNVTVAGDGGAILTDDNSLARAARSLRDVGRSESGYHHERIGYTARLNTVNAAIGRIQIQRLDEWNGRRQEVAARYTEEFSDLDIHLPPSADENVTPAWYFYTIRSEQRDALREYLDENGIETGRQYRCPVHLQPPYREMGYSEGDFERAEQWSETVLTLPCHQHLSEQQVDYLVKHLRGFFQ
ncbi:DegT/DnrJ/EryC1/StrS family aminotransferase [Halopiger aswanensis]|uniref:Perosamine synthetase n=1 Tax=Halopiger aswanensis TaxID=148449 RepID=A0A419WRK1_9EURY|nr:DegT/DnrJ/EryC1/StrS family aminotransferase [Halopiger aswanensis]RKD98052.1 perosamine synthetase [Halopiger aswanensis]